MPNHIELENVSLAVNISSGNAAMMEDPKAELKRMLEKAIEEINDADFEDGDIGALMDLNGNKTGEWDLTIDSSTYWDEDEAREQFKSLIAETGMVVGNNQTKTNCVDEAQEIDPDVFNEELANWVDAEITNGNLPSEANGWDIF